MTLSGKVALILGGGRGIGAATARTMAAQGANVAISYINNSEAAEGVLQAIKETGAQGIALRADARDPEQIQRLVQETLTTFGRIDSLVHSVPPQGVFKPFLRMSWEEFMLAPTRELQSVYEITRAVLPLMQQQRYGRIVYVASGVAKSPSMDGASSLGAAFGALISLAKHLAKEYGPDGITVNTITPAMVNTELSSMIPAAARQHLAAATPLRRIAEPEDIARVIAFLASDESGFMTGTCIPVNGGISME